METDGYLRLTDYGTATLVEGDELKNTFCGTPEYLAPEMLCGLGHSYPVDWWTLGILTYELIVGFPPFYTGSSNNSKMFYLIKTKAVMFPDPERHKIVMSAECQDFISRILVKDPTQRLGTHGDIEEILAHPWFNSLNIQKILAKEIEVP